MKVIVYDMAWRGVDKSELQLVGEYDGTPKDGDPEYERAIGLIAQEQVQQFEEDTGLEVTFFAWRTE